MLARFWPYVQPHRRLLLAALVAVPVVSILGLLPPVLMMHGIDVNLRGQAPKEAVAVVLEGLGLSRGLEPGAAGLKMTVILYLTAVLLEYLSRSFQVFGLQYVGAKGVGRLRHTLYRHVTNRSASFFDRHPTGALLTRATSDIEALGESLTTGAVTILGDVFNMTAILVMMFLLSPKLTLAVLLLSPVLVGSLNFFRRRLREAFLGVRRTLAEVNAFMQEHLAGVRLVQLYHREEATYRAFKATAVKNLQATQRSNIYDVGLYAVMEGLSGLAVALVLWYGSGEVLKQALSLGLLVAFIEYIQRLFVPIKELSGKFAILQQASAAMERVLELLGSGESITPGTVKLGRLRGELSLEEVRFRYRAGREEVLKGVSFRVAPGEVVAIVGHTGSGKSTLGRLLTRQYDGYEGRIRVDGLELRELDPASVRSQVAVVQQDVILFPGTVAFNISLGNPAIDQAKVEEAARVVQAHEQILELPGGYGFEVAERGANLSAGQAQLIAFARAMAHEAPVVLLDEATAAVDSQTEAAIQRAIEALFARRTVLVIAHRLSTIRAADRIVVLEGGQVMEEGTHEGLLAAEGRYAALYRTGLGEGAPG